MSGLVVGQQPAKPITVGQLAELLSAWDPETPVLVMSDGGGWGYCSGYDIAKAPGKPVAVVITDRRNAHMMPPS